MKRDDKSYFTNVTSEIQKPKAFKALSQKKKPDPRVLAKPMLSPNSNLTRNKSQEFDKKRRKKAVSGYIESSAISQESLSHHRNLD